MPAGKPVWDVSEGPGGLLIAYDEELDPSGIRNVWVTLSDHPDTNPVRGIAIDDDDVSPTRVDRFGYFAERVSNPHYSTQEQCDKAAEALLAGSRGLSVSLDLTAAPNPWLDLPDPISSTRGGVRSVHVLDRITHSLLPDQPMTLQAAARTVAIEAEAA
jgi:hypothetical protein